MKLPTIGYIGDLYSGHAGFRYRVDAPMRLHGLDYVLGTAGDVTLMFRAISKYHFEKLKELKFKSIYDITDFHLDRDHEIGVIQRSIIMHATIISVASKKLQEKLYKDYRLNSEVIEDCYTNEEWLPSIPNDNIVWFGHPSNTSSLRPYLRLDKLIVCSKNIETSKLVQYSEKTELQLLKDNGLVLLTSSNPMTNGNRIIRALRAGKFIITPNFNVEAWNEFKDFIWQGDVSEGIKWALANRDEALWKVKLGQDYIREKFSPVTISNMWRELFIRVYNTN